MECPGPSPRRSEPECHGPDLAGIVAIGAAARGENSLEIELTSLKTTGRKELSGDMFNKPFQITPSFEFMIGAGPEFSQTVNGPDRGTTAV
jgi:hypothetical protein